MSRQVYAGVWLAATLAAGCVVEARPLAPGGVVVVSGPPPEPMRETRPRPAMSGAQWIAGYWHWTGMQYTWIPGHWEVRTGGARWRPPRYRLRDGVYYYEPGGWVVAPP